MFNGTMAAWPVTFTSPFGGAVTQSILPLTFNNQVSYAGSPEIESRIVADIASFGRQIGIISEALVELAGATGSGGPKVARLRTLMAEIEDLKAQHRRSILERVTSALDTLDEQSPASADNMLDNIERAVRLARTKLDMKRRERGE